MLPPGNSSGRTTNESVVTATSPVPTLTTEASPSAIKRAEKLRDDGQELFRSGKYEEAQAKLKEARKLNPNDPAAHKLLGATLANTGEMDEAVVEYQAYLRRTNLLLPIPRSAGRED